MKTLNKILKTGKIALAAGIAALVIGCETQYQGQIGGKNVECIAGMSLFGDKYYEIIIKVDTGRLEITDNGPDGIIDSATLYSDTLTEYLSGKEFEKAQKKYDHYAKICARRAEAISRRAKEDIFE